MREIVIKSKKHGTHIVLVDDENYPELNIFKWRINKNANCLYAVRWDYSECTKRLLFMHRVILGINNPKEIIDHIDHNGLNNQKDNLRVTTTAKNSANRTSKKNGTSKYLGVSIMNIKSNGKEYKYWRSYIQSNKVSKWLGMFKTEEAAALAYNNAAKELHGEFANLNKIA